VGKRSEDELSFTRRILRCNKKINKKSSQAFAKQKPNQLKMKTTTRIQLSAMMFLEFFIWGSWYVTMKVYLQTEVHATDVQVGAAYSAMAIATIFSPFFIGMIADKFFPAQQLLGVLHILGAFLLFYLTKITDANSFYWVLLLYSLIYAPTLALCNSVSFNQMQNPAKQFASIRILGTIGWIVAGLLIDKVFHLSQNELGFTFKMAAVASGILGVMSFTLPNTPPKAKGTKATFSQVLGSDAYVLFKDRSFITFFIASILICIPLSFYYTQTYDFLVARGMKNAASNMTFGQISEAACILLIPFFFRRLGVKWMIAVGMIAWTVRFLLFSYGNGDELVWMLFAGIILHGVCFDFFFVTGQIYTDSKAGEKIKSSAQGMITMATYGIGMWIGTLLSGYVANYYTLSDGKTHDWKGIWLVPAMIAAGVLVYFLLFFREKKQIANAV
jgi:nucleoside transporter